MKYLHYLLLAFAAIGVVSCGISAQESLTLPNGTVITESEKAALDALSDDATAIFTARLGEARARDIASGGSPDTSDDENFAVMEDLKALLRSEFGEDAEKYIIEGEFGEESATSPAADLSTKGFGIVDGLDSIWQYRMVAEAKYCMLPWGSWNWATTRHGKTRIIPIPDSTNSFNDPVLSIRAMIQDEKNPSGVSVTKSQTFEVTATGNPKYGFFPKIKNIVSEHEVWDENIWNGHILRRYSWTM